MATVADDRMTMVAKRNGIPKEILTKAFAEYWGKGLNGFQIDIKEQDCQVSDLSLVEHKLLPHPSPNHPFPSSSATNDRATADETSRSGSLLASAMEAMGAPSTSGTHDCLLPSVSAEATQAAGAVANAAATSASCDQVRHLVSTHAKAIEAAGTMADTGASGRQVAPFVSESAKANHDAAHHSSPVFYRAAEAIWAAARKTSSDPRSPCPSFQDAVDRSLMPQSHGGRALSPTKAGGENNEEDESSKQLASSTGSQPAALQPFEEGKIYCFEIADFFDTPSQAFCTKLPRKQLLQLLPNPAYPMHRSIEILRFLETQLPPCQRLSIMT